MAWWKTWGSSCSENVWSKSRCLKFQFWRVQGRPRWTLVNDEESSSLSKWRSLGSLGSLLLHVVEGLTSSCPFPVPGPEIWAVNLNQSEGSNTSIHQSCHVFDHEAGEHSIRPVHVERGGLCSQLYLHCSRPSVRPHLQLAQSYDLHPPEPHIWLQHGQRGNVISLLHTCNNNLQPWAPRTLLMLFNILSNVLVRTKVLLHNEVLTGSRTCM